jgi:hypothetical protein
MLLAQNMEPAEMSEKGTGASASASASASR